VEVGITLFQGRLEKDKLAHEELQLSSTPICKNGDFGSYFVIIYTSAHWTFK